MERAKLRKRIKRDKWDLDAGDMRTLTAVIWLMTAEVKLKSVKSMLHFCLPVLDHAIQYNLRGKENRVHSLPTS